MRKIKSIILPLSFICLIISMCFFLVYIFNSIQDRQVKEELIRKKLTVSEAAITDGGAIEKNEILPELKGLYLENSDLIGWIKIENTPIDYPVMQNREEGEYYLHRNFKKEYEYSGLPFLDKRCDISLPSTNLIIYGHNMKSDAMFSSLLKYQEEVYYLKHPVIEFDTLYEQDRYEIIAVIRSKVFKKTDQDFKFYQFVQADSREAFDEYIDNMKNLSLYDTGVEAAYGDQLLSLITCSYHTDNGRLAVLAKKLDD